MTLPFAAAACAIILAVAIGVAVVLWGRAVADSAAAASSSAESAAGVLDRRAATIDALTAQAEQDNCVARIQAQKGSIQLQFDALIGRLVADDVKRSDPAYEEIRQQFQTLAVAEADVQAKFDHIDELCFQPNQAAIDRAREAAGRPPG